MSLSRCEVTRYQRHLTLGEIGVDGQEKLKAARVLVVGMGGLGCPAALYLAASGVGTLGILDDDRIELSNLQRQILYTTQDVGRLKVEVAHEKLTALNPDIRTIPHAVRLDAGNIRSLFEQYDIVLDGTDRFSTRYLVNDGCVLMRKTLISAAIQRFAGQLFSYVPDRGPCYRCLFPEQPAATIPDCGEAGVLGVLPGAMGTLQATEAIKLIVALGMPVVGRLLSYDALHLRIKEFPCFADVQCKVCSKQRTLLEPAGDSADTIRYIDARELRWSIRHGTVGVIDVREPDEFSTGHIEGAINIPLAMLDSRVAELPNNGLLVFVCRSGVRSVTACTKVQSRTTLSVATLRGGLTAWERRD